ncbi:MAG: ATP-binding cassette domain-containing protein [Bdellovibrionota bacterium]
MNFMANVYVECEYCLGKRYTRDTLNIKYKDKSIADILEMTVDEAYDFFKNHKKLERLLSTLLDVGLDYITLGQAATTLSGGEAQRIKLSKELSKRSFKKALYILDEPTTGLHFEDIRKLNSLLQRLVDEGNSVVVIEHNLDIIRSADHIIELGPQGGKYGGNIVFTGSLEELKKAKTATSKFV